MTGAWMRGSRRLRWWSAACLVVLLAAAAAVAPSARAQDRVEELGEEIEEAEQQAEQLDDKADQAEQRRDAAQQEIQQLDGKVASASQELQAAQQRVQEAEAAAAEARRKAEKAQKRLEASERKLKQKRDELETFARDSYKYGTRAMEPMMMALESMASARNPVEFADSVHFLELSMDDMTGLVEETKRLVAKTEKLRDEAAAARSRSEQRLATARAASTEAASAHARMQQLVGEADAALQRRAAAVADLEDQHAQTQERIDELEAARQEALEEAREEEAQGSVSMSASYGEMVNVGGIVVHESLAPELQALLEDARADGIHFTGYGYRSPETTARLRMINGCPDVHDSPPSSCDVPTAPPGASMHEQGLAVDFNYQGATICFPSPPSECHGNPGFEWLEANAHNYGLYVLSTEAWHWSTNGN